MSTASLHSSSARICSLFYSLVLFTPYVLYCIFQVVLLFQANCFFFPRVRVASSRVVNRTMQTPLQRVEKRRVRELRRGGLDQREAQWAHIYRGAAEQRAAAEKEQGGGSRGGEDGMWQEKRGSVVHFMACGRQQLSTGRGQAGEVRALGKSSTQERREEDMKMKRCCIARARLSRAQMSPRLAGVAWRCCSCCYKSVCGQGGCPAAFRHFRQALSWGRRAGLS